MALLSASRALDIGESQAGGPILVLPSLPSFPCVLCPAGSTAKDCLFLNHLFLHPDSPRTSSVIKRECGVDTRESSTIGTATALLSILCCPLCLCLCVCACVCARVPLTLEVRLAGRRWKSRYVFTLFSFFFCFFKWIGDFGILFFDVSVLFCCV